jgi:predicted dehydrogenase
MSINEEEIDKIIAAEEKSQASVCVCFQNRFSPSVIKALELAREDGGALSAYASVFWDRGEKYYTESGWRGKYSTEGGGVMINQAIHAIDLLCEFLGKPESVKSKIANFHLDGIVEVEDSCGGVITHRGGLKSNFYATTAAEMLCSTVIYVKTKSHIIEVRNYRLYLDGEFVDTSEHTCYAGKACYGNGHEELIDSFYGAIRNGLPMPVTAESARWALRVLLAAYRSDGAAESI